MAKNTRKTFSINQPLPPELEENVKKRFIREAQLQSGVDHKNIVPIVHLELEADPPFYLMPVAESSLDRDIAKDRAISGQYRMAISDIVSGLEELHSMHMYHRDLKPQNVLRFSDTGGKDYYAIGDFGFISLQDSRLSKLTSTGMKKGADYYTAPEITRDLRKASPQSDIYSLACILHDMVGIDDRIPCNEIREGGEFGPLLQSCTRSDPKRRFKSATAVRDALLAITAEAVSTISSAAGDVLKALDQDKPLSATEVNSLADYLEDSWSSREGHMVLQKLTGERLGEFCNADMDGAARIGSVVAQWVSNSGFDFDFCDALAQRLRLLVEQMPYDVKAECLLALLELGTTHNRWYVERTFTSLCGPDMEEGLAKRLAVEFRADSRRICGRISQLERSISVSRNSLHPALVQTLAEIC